MTRAHTHSDTHGRNVQGFTAAIDTLVESLGQTVVPEEDANEEEEEEVEELDVE